MPTLSVLTPSFLPDLELCRDLHNSILRFAPTGVAHRVVVPRKDQKQFAGIGEVQVVTEFLPRSFHALPRNMWLNLQRPFPVVRGWIAQQLIKLAAVAAAETDVVLLVDSDVVFVRHFSEQTFHRAGVARFYRSPDAIDVRLPRHIIWHKVARRLLGLPPVTRTPLPDYICWPMCWDPKIVRAMLRRVEEVTGKPWPTAIGAELHFSEGILYGVYVDEVQGGSAFSEQTMLCIAHCDEVPFNARAARAFVDTLLPSDIAIMISAKSRTALEVRRHALSAAASGRLVAASITQS